ncbi:penicillin-binding protein 2 [Sphingomonas suaedae]|uniref:Penicillin-binding protein 2 n=1 Tax=Sphingomonas suaedae TaxID=2599297 RepID=A0A518REN9_9SPHN|nr:penicillin-binding protein 2 [Sphingomonas suaedae]QDX25898.1 penicillin-binding protein 2 [Sphingomonas suaedae]
MTVLVAPAPRLRSRDGNRASPIAVAHVRLMILTLLFAAAICVIVARLALLAVMAEPAQATSVNAMLVPLRGDLVDRNGAPLARTIDAWSIGVRPGKVIGDKAQLAQMLAATLPGHSAADYAKMLNSDAKFTYLKRRAVPELVAAVHALGEPGIEFAREPQRLYPQATLAAHALGFVNFDGQGISGAELILNKQLTDPARRGQPVALSIDLRAQAALESELGAAMTSFQARGAAGVILDVATGEVMAMTSLPTFNPNNVKGANPEHFRNNVTQSVYELGSTFKPLTMAFAIESGVAPSMSKRYDATQPLQVGAFRIRDDHAQKRWLNIPETLIHSSNIATARIADELGKDRMAAMFQRLGFHDRMPIELNGAAKPLWPQYWARTTVMTTAYGHGIAVTPLHLASAYAAMVNGGVWRPATLQKVEPGKAPAGQRVISEATSARMRQLLRLIVTHGTGSKADAPGYRVGGKTGTAEVPGRGGYQRNKNVSTFAAAFPMDAPRYVVLVMLDSPIGNEQSAGQSTAGWTAAPVVNRVVMRTGAMLGVVPDERRDVDVSDLTPLLWEPDAKAKPATAALGAGVDE